MSLISLTPINLRCPWKGGGGKADGSSAPFAIEQFVLRSRSSKMQDIEGEAYSLDLLISLNILTLDVTEDDKYISPNQFKSGQYLTNTVKQKWKWNMLSHELVETDVSF